MKELIAQRFQLQHLLGEGTFAEVWRAIDTQVGDGTKTVAVKIFRPMAQSKHSIAWEPVRNEIAAAQKISPHPNILRSWALVKARHFGEVETPCLVFDDVNAMNLAEFLAQLPPPHPDTISSRLQVMTGLLRAIAHTHQCEVVHRDLSFGNVLVPQTGELTAILTDFGSSQVAESISNSSLDAAIAESAQTLQPINHPPYNTLLSLANGYQRDVYAFAVLAYLALAGRHPLTDHWQTMRTGVWTGPDHPHEVLPRRTLVELLPWIQAFPQLVAVSDLLFHCVATPLTLRPKSGIEVWQAWSQILYS